MKKLLVPLLIALLGGVGAGTGLTFVRETRLAEAEAKVMEEKATIAKAAADSAKAADSVAVADSIAMVPKDSVLTPAESLRAVAASRTPLRDAARARNDAKPSHTTQATREAGTTTAASKAGIDSITSVGGEAKPATTVAKPDVRQAIEAVRGARDDALATAMPEERLAKIFAAMQAKDAAKVLDQMEDRDIRAVLSLMGDRQAAAILTALSPARAATITRGALRAAGADK